MNASSVLTRLYSALNGRHLRLAGMVISLLLVLLVCRVLYLERAQLEQVDVDAGFLVAASAGVGVVVLGNLLGSMAGWLLLRGHSPALSLPFLITVTGLAQLAKYLPGNVLHLVGRFIVIKERSDAKVALAFSIYELLLLCLSGAALGLLYVHFVQPAAWSLPLLALLALALLGAGIRVLHRLGFLRATVVELAGVVTLYLLSYLAYGLALSLLFQLVFDLNAADVLLCAVLFALAFVVGYVTPGASGGLGVREFVFMILAQPLLDSTLAATAIVLFRLFSVAGDLVFALLALGVKRGCGVRLAEG